MRKFELMETSKEFAWKNRNEITEGCTLDSENAVTLETFETKEHALKALEKFNSKIEKNTYVNTFYHVTEYSVLENIYDNDNEFVATVGTWETSKFDSYALEKLED